MKKLKKVHVICGTAVLGLLCAFIGTIEKFPSVRSSAEETVAGSESATVSAMDSDTFNYNGKEYDITEYYQKDNLSEDLFGCTYEMLPKNDGTGKMFYEVYGDDPIVNLIPKKNFYTEGSYFTAGNEWGYFMKTQESFPTVLYEDTTDKKTSFVTIFDIEHEYDVAAGEIQVTVEPLYQFEYVSLAEDETFVGYVIGDGYDAEAYPTPIEYELVGETDFYTVIPATRKERRRYYFKDISYAISLYNEQEANAFNGGELYNPQLDNGAYLVGMDYAYNGIVRENKEFPLDSVVTLAKPVFDYIVGSIPGVSTVVKGLETVINTVKSAQKYALAFSNIVDYIDNPTMDVSQEKPITSTAFNANRDEQIQNYGMLLKSTGLIVKTDPNEKSVWYGIGNSATVVFRINDTALNGKAHNYTRAVNEIGMTVVDSVTDEVENIDLFTNSFSLFDPVYKEIELEEGEDIFLLPDGTNYFKFTPQYSGNYELETEHDELLDIVVTESNGNEVQGTDSGYDLTGGHTYYILIKSTGNGVVSKLYSSVSENTGGNLTPGEKRIVSCPIEEAAVYSFASGNKNVVISEIYAEIADFAGDSIVNDSEKVDLALEEGNCFVILENIGDQAVSYQLVANRELPSVAAGSGQEYQLSKKHFSYIQITGLEKGHEYIITTSVKGLTITAYGDGLTKLPMTYYANGNYKIFADGENIYFGAIADSDVITAITVNKSENAYTWTINGKKQDTTAINLEIGKEYQLGFLINGIVQGDQFKVTSDPFATNLHFSLKGNVLTIENYCEFNTGNSLEVRYKYSDVATYDYALYIQPVYNVEVLNFAAVNDESLGFSYVQKEYLSKICYELTIGNETKQYEELTIYNDVGSVYTENVSGYVNNFTTKIGQMTLKIYKVILETDRGTIECECEYSFSMHSAYAGGAGTYNNPYILTTDRHFRNLSYNSNNNVYFDITDVINYSGYPVKNFYGILTGKVNWLRYDISLTIGDGTEKRSELGLFINNYGTIRDLHIDAEMAFTGGPVGRAFYAGAIAGHNYGRIENCTSDTTATTDFYAGYTGGLVGENLGTIIGCWASVRIDSCGNIGGIAGINKGTIQDCSATGWIYQNIIKYLGEYTENTCAGGIVGENRKIIKNCNVGFDFDSSLRLYIIVDEGNQEAAPFSGPVYGKNTNGSVSGCKEIKYFLDEGNLIFQGNINDDYGN